MCSEYTKTIFQKGLVERHTVKESFIYQRYIYKLCEVLHNWWIYKTTNFL